MRNNAGKIRRELGWRPSICFDDGLSQTVCWYVNVKQAGFRVG